MTVSLARFHQFFVVKKISSCIGRLRVDQERDGWAGRRQRGGGGGGGGRGAGRPDPRRRGAARPRVLRPAAKAFLR